jgi:transposase-like protein
LPPTHPSYPPEFRAEAVRLLRVTGKPPGPVPPIDDEELVRLICQVLKDSPFAGEGYRKVRARLGREHGVQVSGKRVLRLLRREGLLAPAPRPSTGSIGY